MPTRGHGELAVTGSVRTAAAMPNDAKRVVRAALATAGKGWVGVAGRRCGKSRCKNGGGLVLDGVHEKMTWPGWKGVVGGGGSSVCLLLFRGWVFLLEERWEPPRRAYLKLGGTDDW